jgi:hypothetical protein
MNLAVESYGIRCQLKAERVDAGAGVIYGATVGKAGVNAMGKYVYLDANGQLTRNPDGARKKLQVKTDQKTLETLMAAAQDAGGRAKSREDHSDDIGARAGFGDNFKLLDGRVVCDLHLFDSYKNRAIVLEAAEKTPGDIGLSIDFTPSFEILDDCAMMRVTELIAVDIVDAGAITPAGLFLNRELDNPAIVKPASTMIENKKPATLEECIASITALAATVSAMQLAAKPAEAAPADAGKETLAAVKELTLKLEQTNERIATMAKESAALGLKISPVGAGGDAAGEAERMRLAKEKETQEAAGKKTYLQLVKETREGNLKLSAGDAHRKVQSERPDAYKLHLENKGVAV